VAAQLIAPLNLQIVRAISPVTNQRKQSSSSLFGDGAAAQVMIPKSRERYSYRWLSIIGAIFYKKLPLTTSFFDRLQFPRIFQ